MPYTYDNYPPAMENMDPKIRQKAIDIVNALMEAGYFVGESAPAGTSPVRRGREGADSKDHSDNNAHAATNGS